jgi:hypothetical protein
MGRSDLFGGANGPPAEMGYVLSEGGFEPPRAYRPLGPQGTHLVVRECPPVSLVLVRAMKPRGARVPPVGDGRTRGGRARLTARQPRGCRARKVFRSSQFPVAPTCPKSHVKRPLTAFCSARSTVTLHSSAKALWEKPGDPGLICIWSSAAPPPVWVPYVPSRAGP